MRQCAPAARAHGHSKEKLNPKPPPSLPRMAEDPQGNHADVLRRALTGMMDGSLEAPKSSWGGEGGCRWVRAQGLGFRV